MTFSLGARAKQTSLSNMSDPGGGNVPPGGGGAAEGQKEAFAGGRRGQFRGSWAEMLSRNLPTSWNKNVLEIILEKDEPGSFQVSDIDCARVMKKIGLDQRPGVHVDAIQICPNGRGIIMITLKKEVPVEQFCRHDVFEVNDKGIRAVNIKPAGKREVVVHVKSIHPNTRDDGVIDYLGKFGKVVANKVIYGVFGDGPLKGFRNGDRSYKMEVKPGMNIGTYHVLDGQKVTIRYPGQLQTCARCHETARTCRGNGMARRCEAEGGQKVDLSDHILKLWKEIGYSPENVELADLNNDDDHENDPNPIQQEGGKFTPPKVPTADPEKFAGVSIKTFAKDTDQCEIIELLIASGLPVTKMDEILIRPNGTVTVKNLTSSVCNSLICALHSQKHLGRKLYCNGIIPFTPEKLPDRDPLPCTIAGSTTTQQSTPTSVNVIAMTRAPTTSPTSSPTANPKQPHMPILSPTPKLNPVPSSNSPTTNAPGLLDNVILSPIVPTVPPSNMSSTNALGYIDNVNLSSIVSPTPAMVTPTQVYSGPLSSTHVTNAAIVTSPESPFQPPNQSLMDIGTSTDIQQFVEDHQMKLADAEFVRRHSLSLRSPTSGSLAADILQTSSVTPNFLRAKSLLSEVKEMAARLSDFESCHSSSEDDLDDVVVGNDTGDEGFKTMNDKKRYWKNKRKNSTTPSKDSFVKKLNQNTSPKY